jgi:hypothetical protein
MGKPLLKENEVPSGGIADFIMTSDEIKQIEALEAREQFGDSGIANFEEIASRMSLYGRFGDDTVAHLQKGEIIVPKALIEQNPVLKESIFNHLKELGIEDPERYVVGSSANSINPDTGMPEFFLGKILKGVKNIFKKVGKVLKKVAPIVLPMVLSAVGIPPIVAHSLGAGIGTLASGGSGKDALKAALFGAVTGSVTAGFSGPYSGPGAFMKNVGTGFTVGNPADWVQNLELVGGKLGDPGTYTTLGKSGFSTGVKGGDLVMKNAISNIPDRPVSSINEQAKILADSTMDASNVVAQSNQIPFLEKSTAEQWKQIFAPKGPTASEIFESAKASGNPISLELAKQKALEQAPSFMRKALPYAAAGTGIMAATGMFNTPKDEEVEYTTGQQLLEENPDKYMLDPEAYRLKYLTNQDFGVPTQYASTAYVDQINNPYLSSQFQQVQTVKNGGEIFPRRTGGIAPDEGVAGKDSVRAMLMPGEFVMTTNAVKGMGNGDLNQGINNMYGMMRNLESRGRMMA